jgi:hypothetical protein
MFEWLGLDFWAIYWFAEECVGVENIIEGVWFF